MLASELPYIELYFDNILNTNYTTDVNTLHVK